VRVSGGYKLGAEYACQKRKESIQSTYQDSVKLVYYTLTLLRKKYCQRAILLVQPVSVSRNGGMLNSDRYKRKLNFFSSPKKTRSLSFALFVSDAM
jgi:hypothetical protein